MHAYECKWELQDDKSITETAPPHVCVVAPTPTNLLAPSPSLISQGHVGSHLLEQFHVHLHSMPCATEYAQGQKTNLAALCSIWLLAQHFTNILAQFWGYTWTWFEGWHMERTTPAVLYGQDGRKIFPRLLRFFAGQNPPECILIEPGKILPGNSSPWAGFALLMVMQADDQGLWKHLVPWKVHGIVWWCDRIITTLLSFHRCPDK